jgi:RNA polymerase sigma factor (sigma-70 family)
VNGVRENAVSEHLLRELAPQVLAAVARRYGDFAAAEDAVQEALLAASRKWPDEGVPENPRAWLIQVAARRAADEARSDAARRRREATLAADDELSVQASDSDEQPEQEDTLLLLFMCCHPVLTRPSAIALTLRAVGGLTTAEIARAFMVPEATMAQRISRAKQLIKQSGVPFRMPSAAERDQRLSAVLHVLYLIFNEGYTTSGGATLQRVDLSSEAIRLARRAHELLPEHTEAAGLLALMLLTDARRRARSGASGELCPLDEQDRSLWDRAAIDEGIELIEKTLPRGQVGPYQIQAAIAAVHDSAERADDTDWPQSLALYQLLLDFGDNPMVRLGHAVAAAMVHGPRHGLALVEALAGDPRVEKSHRLAAVRGHLHERAGDAAAAVEQYRAAADGTASTPERNYLLMKAAALAEKSN